jgi:hypothetical protein
VGYIPPVSSDSKVPKISSHSTLPEVRTYTWNLIKSKIPEKRGFRAELQGSFSKMTKVSIPTSLKNGTKVRITRTVNGKKIVHSSVKVRNSSISFQTRNP